jgi:NADPH-dependent 2,4-dienoyl-CoA reductase/sulfur reductase-like enzyme
MRKISCDVAIFGGGPAGIAAAVTASQAGMKTLLIDEGLAPGGQIWRGASVASGGSAGRWLRALAAAPAEIHSRTRVVAYPEPQTVMLESPEGPLCLRFLRAVVCPGARELFLPFPGWTLPGVSGAGGLQALVKNGLPMAGKRVVVAGSGPLLLVVAQTLVKAGARIELLAEQASAAQMRKFAGGLWRYPGKAFQAISLLPQALRVKNDTWVQGAEGRDKLEQVRVSRNGQTVIIPCDYLACGFGLIPNTELPALFGCKIESGSVVVNESLHTSQQNILCAGEVIGIGGVDAAIIEGCMAGHSVAQQPEKAAALMSQRKSIRAFAAHLEQSFALRSELKSLAAPKVLLCRCEDVLTEAVSACHSWTEARLLTRCGMGACQGRVCGAAARFLYDWNSTTARPPLQPTSIKHLCLPEKTTEH